MRVKTPLCLALLCALTWSAVVRADIIIDGYTDATNDRFTNDSSFIANAHDLSGIGRTADRRWGTLISSNVVISAYHFRPKSTLTFYETNDASGSSETREVVLEKRLGDSDVWIGVLNAPLPASYQPLAFATETFRNSAQFNNSVYGGAAAFLVGNSPADPPNNQNLTQELDMAVGQNRLTDYLSGVTVNSPSGSATGNAIRAYQNISGESAYLPYEAFLQDKDSGAPMLVDVSGELRVVGLNWFIGTAGSYNTSACSYIGDFASDIQAVIDAYDGLDVKASYANWIALQLPDGTDINDLAPDLDYDNDGLSNYDEFALVYDPTAYDNAPAGSPVAVSSFVQVTFDLQENDDELNYRIEVGSDLIGWTTTTLTCNGSTWSTGSSAVAEVVAATDQGDYWTVTIRDATAMSNGSARFMHLLYD